MSEIADMKPGDYVKTGPNRYEEIASVYGVGEGGRLAKPSEGFWGVMTTGGRDVSGWNARAYVKRADLPPNAYVLRP